MEFAVGAIVEGKVTGITKFGAFVSLPGNKTGMVHISEIAHAYVSDINEHLTVGQEVKVKIIAIDPAGKINLSIKKTQEAPARQERPRGDRPMGNRGDRPERPPERSDRPRSGGSNKGGFDRSQKPAGPARSSAPKEPQSFDDMLKAFMADSDSKISSIKQYSEHRTKKGRR